MLVCPTGSGGREGKGRPPERAFPMELEKGLYFCGFNSQDSYGANSYLLQRRNGNMMSGSPKFVPRLEREIENLGGVAHILLTHRDDVADADKWAKRFGARVWIGEADRSAAPFATDVIPNGGDLEIARGVRAIHVPGHTCGHVAYLAGERYLSSGDAVSWSRTYQDLEAFRDATWHSWEGPSRSLERLPRERFCGSCPPTGSSATRRGTRCRGGWRAG